MRVNTVRCDRRGLIHVVVDLPEIRRKRLLRFAELRQVQDNPSGLGLLIGKKPNQVYNLLHGSASFGEKVARSIEQAAGLPWGYLDTEDGQLPGWPFRSISIDRFLVLSAEDRGYVEGRVETAIESREIAATFRVSEPDVTAQVSADQPVIDKTHLPERHPGEMFRTTRDGGKSSAVNQSGPASPKRGRGNA